MKKVLLILLLFSWATSYSQTYWKLDLQDEWRGTDVNWNNFQQSNSVIAAGNLTVNNLIKSDGSSSTVGVNFVSGFMYNSSTAAQGSDLGVFDDLIEGHGWRMQDNAGAHFRFTGLNNSKYYTVYVLVASWSYEGGTVSFTTSEGTSNSVSTALNVGDHNAYPNWEKDPALNSLVNIVPISGNIDITMNLTGYGYIEAIVLKEQTGFWVPTNPAAPTGGIVDDVNNTFNFTLNPSYPLVSQYEYTVDSGYTWHELRTKPLVVNNVSIKAGYLGVRVKDTLDQGAGFPLFNASPFTITATNPASSVITIKVKLSGTPTTTTVLAPTNLKYGKWGRFGMTVDNRSSDATVMGNYISGKTFTDGATTNGHNIKWSASIGTQAYWNTDSTQDASVNSGVLSWSAINTLVTNGWSVLDNGAFNGINTTGASALQFNQLMNAAQNREYTYRQINYVLRYGLVPNTDPNYHSAWEQLGYLGGVSTTITDGYPNTVPASTNHGLVNVTGWKSDNRYKVHLRHFKNLTAGNTASQEFFDAAYNLAWSSNSTTNYSVEYGFKNATLDTVQRVIDSAYVHFNDHIWVCGLQEFYEYFQTIQQTGIKQSVSHDTLTITLDQTYLPDELRWRDMSFALNSDKSISVVSVTGADDYSYNASTGLINVFKKKTTGYTQPDNSVQTGFAFHSKIPFTPDQVYIDNHFDYRPSALVDGDTATVYNTGGGMLYFPYDVTLNLVDFGAVVDSVRVRILPNVGTYSTTVLLARNDNEAEDSIGVFTDQATAKWLTFTLRDTNSKYVASRVILRSNSKGGFGTEVRVYGNYLPYMGQTFTHAPLPLKYEIGTNGHWWNWEVPGAGTDNENAFKAVDSMHLYSVRNYGDASTYQENSPPARWLLNPTSQGYNEDQMWRRFKTINPSVVRFSVIQGQSLSIQDMWNTPDSTRQLRTVVTSVTEYGPYSILNVNGIAVISGTVGSTLDRIRIVKKGSPNSTGHNSDSRIVLQTGAQSFGTDPNAGFAVGDTVNIYYRYKSALNMPYPQTTMQANRSIPELYDTAARFGYTWTARRGRNTLATKYVPAPGNNDSVGLNTAEWIEIFNEPTASWGGFNEYLNGNNLGLAWSKMYDNNKVASTTLGVKNADTSMIMSTSGLAVSDPDVMYGAEAWVRKNRGNRAKAYVPTQPMTWKAKTFGWSDNPYNIIQFHNYSYTGGSNQYAGNVQSGLPIELSHSLDAVNGFTLYRDKYAPLAKNDVGEWGYDLAQRSTMNAPPIGSYTAEQVRGAWSVRTMMVNNAHGVDYSQWYRFAQDDPNGDTSNAVQFSTMSLIVWDYSNNIQLTTVARNFGQLAEFGDYSLDSVLREDSIYCYRYKKDTNYVYAVWGIESSPNQSNWKNEKALFTERTGSISLPVNAVTYNVRKLVSSGNVMSKQTLNTSANTATVTYGLSPTFIQFSQPNGVIPNRKKRTITYY